MLKQVIITGITAAGLLLSMQASAHQVNSHGSRVNNNHSHNNYQPVRRAPPPFNVNKEQREQATMIAQGVKTCQITPKEAQALYAQQNRIKKAEKRMRRDGLQNRERNTLKQRLHNARVKINNFTKNAKNCRPTRWNNSHGHRGNAHRSNNGRGHSTLNLSSGRGSISISVGH